MKRLVSTASVVVVAFLLTVLFSCATSRVSVEDKAIPKREGEIQTAEELRRGPVPRTFILGVTPRRYFLYKELDTRMMYEAQAAELVRGLTLEDKVGQLFIISLWNAAEEDYSLQAGTWEKQQLDFIRPGGIILFGGNIDTEEQVEKMCSGLQGHSRTPLFLATDQEGGYIGRLYESGKISATRLPPPLLIGGTENTDYAYLAGWITGRETAGLGFNIVFAPVADVLGSTTHPVIGSRSFGTDPRRVASMSLAFAGGLRESGVLPVLKHFPGHGGAEADPHVGSTVDNRSFREIEEADLLPFAQGIEAGIDCIMVSHVIMPEVSGDDLPASCSRSITTELLRGNLGFRGIAVTDSISMRAITSRWSVEEAVLAVLHAGADCILEPPAPRQAFSALVTAVREGTVSESRIDLSVRRVITVKLKAGIIPWEPEWGPDPRVVSGLSPPADTAAAIIGKYISGWRQLESGGIGNDLHQKINARITEAARADAAGKRD
jgi:beta-N-acetylhexosaminidase